MVDIRDEIEGSLALACREVGLRGFRAYCEWVREEALLPRQEEWAEIFLRDGDDVVVAPPGTYKSSLMRKMLEWLVGLDQESTNLWVMNTEPQSQLQVGAIGSTLEGMLVPRYKQVFPWVTPDRVRGWNKTLLFVMRRKVSDADPTLYGAGYTGAYQGLHPQRIFVDDMTDQRDVDQPSVMKVQREIMRGVLADRWRPVKGVLGQGRKVIMTRWGDSEDSDLLSTLRALGYRVHQYPIEGDYKWGRLLAPDVYDDQRLDAIREAKEAVVVGEEEIYSSSNLYQTTFMCNPGRAGGEIIKRGWWRYYHTLPETFHHVLHSWDLATGRGRGHDYTAYQAWGRADNGYYLIGLDRWRDVGSPLSVEREMQVQYTAPEGRLRPRQILVEDVGSSTGVVDYLKEQTALPILAVRPGTRDKKARVDAVLGLIEAGRVWLPANNAKAHEFVAEASAFTGRGDRHDDWVDCMTQAVRFMLARAGSNGEGGGAIVGGPKGDARWRNQSRVPSMSPR